MKPMRVVHFIIFVVLLGWCCLQSGCVAEDDADNDDNIIVINVFTPDNDEDNNYFEVRSEKDNEVSLKIFTRSGVLIFSIEARRCVWNGYTLSGQPMPAGMYYYTAEVREPKVSKSGFVYLYR